MNEKRRKELRVLSSQLNVTKVHIEEIKDAEQACFDKLPESFQYSDMGDHITEAIDHLDDAVSSIEDAMDSIKEAME